MVWQPSPIKNTSSTSIVPASFCIGQQMPSTIANPCWIPCFAARMLFIELIAISTIVSASCCIVRIYVIAYIPSPSKGDYMLHSQDTFHWIHYNLHHYIRNQASDCCIGRVIAITIAKQRWIPCFAARILFIELVAISTIISTSCCIEQIKVIAYTIANAPC